MLIRIGDKGVSVFLVSEVQKIHMKFFNRFLIDVIYRVSQFSFLLVSKLIEVLPRVTLSAPPPRREERHKIPRCLWVSAGQGSPEPTGPSKGMGVPQTSRAGRSWDLESSSCEEVPRASGHLQGDYWKAHMGEGLDPETSLSIGSRGQRKGLPTGKGELFDIFLLIKNWVIEVFRAGLFIIDRTWKWQKCPLVEEWVHPHNGISSSVKARWAVKPWKDMEGP